MNDRYLNPFTDFGFKKEHGHIQYFKNLPLLQDRPKRIQERVFERLFEAAEISRFDPSEREAYEESIKVYRDLKNVMDTQWEEGLQEGSLKAHVLWYFNMIGIIVHYILFGEYQREKKNLLYW